MKYEKDTELIERIDYIIKKITDSEYYYGKYINQFDTYDEAVEKTGIAKRQIQRNIYGEKKSGGGGNAFAKYAGTAVFAPLIFTIPFPTMVNTPYQENQQKAK